MAFDLEERNYLNSGLLYSYMIFRDFLHGELEEEVWEEFQVGCNAGTVVVSSNARSSRCGIIIRFHFLLSETQASNQPQIRQEVVI